MTKLLSLQKICIFMSRIKTPMNSIVKEQIYSPVYVPIKNIVPVVVSRMIYMKGWFAWNTSGSRGTAELSIPAAVTAAALVPFSLTLMFTLCRMRETMKSVSEILEKSALAENAVGMPMV